MTLRLDQLVADQEWGAAVVLHPHPDMGGDRFHPVVDAIFRRLPTVGLSTARFDFSTADRGAAAAEANHAVELLRSERNDRPVVLVGYSFGAIVAADLDHEALVGWCLVAPVLGEAQAPAAARDARPKLVVVPEHDQFAPPDAVRLRTRGWSEATMVVAGGRDHFLAGGAGLVAEEIVRWLDQVVRPAAGAVSPVSAPPPPRPPEPT